MLIRQSALALAALTWLCVPYAHADAHASKDASWAATWSTAGQTPLLEEPRAVENQTLRQIVRITKGGDEVRVRLSNVLGKKPLTIDAASVGVRAEEARLEPGSVHALKFGGTSSITIPPGAVALSDTVALKVKDAADLAISLYVKGPVSASTYLVSSHQTSYLSAGDFTATDTFEPSGTFTSWYWLAGVDVRRPHAKTIVAFGDSITEGYGSTTDLNARWPDFLAERLLDAGDNHSVVNTAISGNRLLNDELGPNALSRLDRDVLTQTGADTAILLEGINDIGFPIGAGDFLPEGVALGDGDPEAIIVGYKQIARRAHDAGLRIFIGTLLPIGGSSYDTPEAEGKRQAVNAYIRGNKDFDGVIDFEKATLDPAKPTQLIAAFDSGDHLHPNDAGYEAMAAAIDIDKLHKAGALSE